MLCITIFSPSFSRLDVEVAVDLVGAAGGGEEDVGKVAALLLHAHDCISFIIHYISSYIMHAHDYVYNQEDSIMIIRCNNAII